MYYGKVKLAGRQYDTLPLTDIDKNKQTAIVQLDGDKHLIIPISRFEYILESFRPLSLVEIDNALKKVY